MKTIMTTWEVWIYDVWGNSDEGYDVNDRHCIDREYPLRLRVKTYNAGSPQEFKAAYPSDYQIQNALGYGRPALDIDGDDLTIYVNRASDGYPLGELYCTSHKSLSPIVE